LVAESGGRRTAVQHTYAVADCAVATIERSNTISPAIAWLRVQLVGQDAGRQRGAEGDQPPSRRTA
jgi:hypothetical protein